MTDLMRLLEAASRGDRQAAAELLRHTLTGHRSATQLASHFAFLNPGVYVYTTSIL